MRRIELWLLLATLGIVAGGNRTAFANPLTYSFSVVPTGGTVQGPAGSTVGWGYSITNNDTTDWLVTTDLTAGTFTNGTPDPSLFDFPDIAPGATVTVPYDPTTGAGLFGLTWNANAPIGFTDSGLFTLSAEWWSGDPLAGGSFLQAAADETAAYSATVSAPVISGLPEPGPAGPLVLVLTIVAGMVWRRKMPQPEPWRKSF
jgi:hypothetical protein